MKMFFFYLFTTLFLPTSSEMLKTIIVPHSHDDVGWLKSFQEYYEGSRTDIDQGNVRAILTNVLEELKKDPKKRFIQVEVAFLKKWWDEASPEARQDYLHMIHEKRIELINGGVSMNDEACAYYEDIIENHTYGHQWLASKFGKALLPTIGWQIDPFGHSLAQAELFSEMGYSEQVIVRFDYEDMDLRRSKKELEVVYELPRAENLFTYMMQNHYSAPPSLNFDVRGADHLTKGNFMRKVNQLVSYLKSFQNHYGHATIMHQVGDDFAYSNAQ